MCARGKGGRGVQVEGGRSVQGEEGRCVQGEGREVCARGGEGGVRERIPCNVVDGHQIKALEAELEEVNRCASQYEQELADSQSQDLQLLDSQVRYD